MTSCCPLEKSFEHLLLRMPGTYLLAACDISQAIYSIFFPSGRNWFKYLTHCPYSKSSLLSRGTDSRDFIRFKMYIGEPYRPSKSSKCFAAGV